jgi:predicted amidophosphoribosyltransferase
LRRRRATRPQSELDADARQGNVRGAFTLSGWTAWRRASWAAKVSGCTLVLVDDVTTTGATLEACGEVLRRYGAREIRAVTIGRVILDTK